MPPPTMEEVYAWYRAEADARMRDKAGSDKLRNALKVLLGDIDHLGHWIPDPCRRLVEDALANAEDQATAK
mgnify:CR=1 FL=1